jgi:hypothetical protein
MLSHSRIADKKKKKQSQRVSPPTKNKTGKTGNVNEVIKNKYKKKPSRTHLDLTGCQGSH